MGRLRSLGVRMERNAKVEEITDKGVRATRNGGSEFFEADSVVLAVGMEPNRELARKLEGKVEALYVIGDSAQPGKITEAIESALRVAREV
jgi:NADPH-dependent 2,4-dienoyl-CoA reductase/sulfur reductase-like enzyme